MEIYLRKSKRFLFGEMWTALDIANVNSNTNYKRGTFYDFFCFVRNHNPYDIIYLENVLTIKMHSFAKRNNFTKLSIEKDSTETAPCYFYASSRQMQNLINNRLELGEVK